MQFSFFKIFSFRNILDENIDVNSENIFLVGENGQGKSNFLEAVYFCSYASSFRNSLDKDLIYNGKTSCSVNAGIKNSINDSIQISIIDEKKNIVIDGKNIKDRKTLISVVPSVVFCHEDLRFVNGTPEERRWFFDQNLSLYDFLYLDDLRRYKKLLKTRNIILRDLKNEVHRNYTLLDVIDPQFVKYGLQIIQKRSNEIKLFSDILNPLYQKISGIENVKVEYRSSWKYDDIFDIVKHLSEKREREIIAGVSLSGPHRDSYFFTKDKYDFSKKSSTGQRRLLALLLRVAQAQRYYAMQKNKPILLLDDVMLELDGKKRVQFLSTLPEYNQAFFTFLPEEPFRKYQRNNTVVYEIVNGHFKKI